MVFVKQEFSCQVAFCFASWGSCEGRPRSIFIRLVRSADEGIYRCKKRMRGTGDKGGGEKGGRRQRRRSLFVVFVLVFGDGG